MRLPSTWCPVLSKIKAFIVPSVFLGLMAWMMGLAIVNSWRADAFFDSIVYAQPNVWPQPPYSPANVSFSTGTGTLVAAPTAGGICVYGLLLVDAGAAVTVNVYLDGGTASVTSAYLAASGGSASWQLSNNPQNPYFITNAATAFVVKQSGTSQIDGSVYAANCP